MSKPFAMDSRDTRDDTTFPIHCNNLERRERRSATGLGRY